MSDIYFEKKATAIAHMIGVCNQTQDYGKMEHEIYIALKEVARDQRYACIDEFKKQYSNLNVYSDNVVKTLHNADIKEEAKGRMVN
jgi:hypothetical protein